MNLTDALNRRAERGPHRHPDNVIAAAAQRRQHTPTDQADRDTSTHEVPLEALDNRTSRRRPALAWAAAAVIAVGGIATIAARQGRPDDGAPAAGNPSTPPVPPLELTEQQHAEAVGNCASGDTPTSAIVDSRPSGILVGLTIDDIWRTCFFLKLPREDGETIIADNYMSPAPSGPLSLLPNTTPEWPITVIDVKPPDGNEINGDEMTWVWGRVDPSIATITITTPTGRYTPTIHDGMFAASWPGNDADRTVLRGFDTAGNEIAFTDQLSCAALEPVETPDALHTAMQPRVVVHGEYAGGGCVAGADVPPGQSPDDIGD